MSSAKRASNNSSVTYDGEAAVRMCHQIQRSIADLEQKGGSEESSPGIPARWDDEREYFAAWRTLGVWKAWVTTKPAAYGITHIKIQATLRLSLIHI